MASNKETRFILKPNPCAQLVCLYAQKLGTQFNSEFEDNLTYCF